MDDNLQEITLGQNFKDKTWKFYENNHQNEIQYVKNFLRPYLEKKAQEGEHSVTVTSWAKDDHKKAFDTLLASQQAFIAIFKRQGITMEVITKNVSITRTTIIISWD